MKGPLRSAVVGCGRMGVEDSSRLQGKVHSCSLPVGHAETLALSDRFDLVAFCDLDFKKASEAAGKYGCGRPFVDVATMLQATAPEVVTVATRTRDRIPLVKSLIEGGVRGIYAEKPFAQNLRDCVDCVELAEEQGTALILGTPRRYAAIYSKARNIALSGEWGEMREIRISLPPGTRLMWAVPHFVDLFLFFAGGSRWESLQAECMIEQSDALENGIDCDPVVTSARVEFVDGLVGTFLEADRFLVELDCEDASIQIFDYPIEGPLLRVLPRPGHEHSGSGPFEERVYGERSGTASAFEELARAVSGEQPLSLAPGEIVLQQSILSGIAVSSLQNARRIGPDEVPPDFTISGRSGNLYA